MIVLGIRHKYKPVSHINVNVSHFWNININVPIPPFLPGIPSAHSQGPAGAGCEHLCMDCERGRALNQINQKQRVGLGQVNVC